MAEKMTKAQTYVLKALAGGRKMSGRLADPDGLSPAKAFIGVTTIDPRTVDVLDRRDLIERTWKGLGHWAATITPAGRRALDEASHG